MFRKTKEKEISNLDDSFASDDSEDDIEDFKPTTRGFEDEFERRKLKWWEFLIFKKEVRIVYFVVLLLGTLVTFAATVDLIFPTKITEEMTSTCGVRASFRSDCLPDYHPNTSLSLQESACSERKCCWDTDNYNGVNCYHRLPSLVSMKYDDRSPDGSNGIVSGPGYDNVSSSSTTAQYLVSSDENGHMLFEVGTVLSDRLDLNPVGTEVLEAIVSCPDSGQDSCIGEMMTLDVRLLDFEQTSIARTHFGPIVYSPELSEITFLLPTNWIFAKDLSNFVFDNKEETSYFNFGESSSVHLPLIIGMHSNQMWYLLYLETDQPGSQTLKPGTGDQPILSWKYLGDNVKVHFFLDQTPAELIRKFNTYIYNNNKTEEMPNFDDSMWKYGLHLCRRNGNPNLFEDDTVGMQAAFLPVDSDCVDEMIMPTSFDIQTTYNLSLATDLKTKLVLPVVVQLASNLAQSPPCIAVNGGSEQCLLGVFNDRNVSVPDVFNPTYISWLAEQYNSVDQTTWSSVFLHGIAPSMEESKMLNASVCSSLEYVPKGLDLSGTPCPTSWVQSLSTKLYNVHASYSKTILEASSSVFSEVKHIRSDVAMVGMPSSITFTGTKVNATWEGMRSSLREMLLLSSLGLPFSSMEACGAFQVQVEDRDLMCLRWIQLAGFMPGIHFWYSGNEQERLPYKLPKSYQRYVGWTMEQRYKLLPYFKTLDRQWYESWLQDDIALPIVRPMFLVKPEVDYINLWTQFFVGDDILVAPVLDSGSDLIDVKFPKGSWYYLGSGNVVSLPSQGATITFHSKVYEIPAFQRGGSVIVSYESAGSNLIDTDADGTFLVKVALECQGDPRVENKQLSFCTSSGVSNLNTPKSKLSVNVSTLLEKGNITLSMDRVETRIHDITSFLIAGLESMGDYLYVTLPDGSTLLATDSIEATRSSDPAAIFLRDKQILMLRNLNISLTTWPEKEKMISWAFDQQQTSPPTPSSSSVFYNM